MANTVAGIHLTGTHAARPAGNAQPDGSLYSCTTHSLVYQSNYAGNSWSTWATLGAAASGSITASGYTQSTARMLGRSTAATGAIEEITVGAGLSLSAGSLTATGSVTPAFVGAKAYHSAAQTLVAATFAAMLMDSEEFDSGTIHDNTTNTSRMVAPSTGKYLLSAYIYFVNIIDQKAVLAQFYKNNATVIRSQPVLHTSTAGSASIGMILTTIASLTAADYVEVRAWRETAGNIGDATNAEQNNNFSFVLLGT